MEPAVVVVGLLLIGIAVYTLSDPMSRSRNGVSAEEWEEDPEQAKEKQRQYALIASVVVGGFGVAFVVMGLWSG